MTDGGTTAGRAGAASERPVSAPDQAVVLPDPAAGVDPGEQPECAAQGATGAAGSALLLTLPKGGFVSVSDPLMATLGRRIEP